MKKLKPCKKLKLCHNVKLSVFVKQGENEEKLAECIKKFSGINEEEFAKKKASINKTSASGFGNEKIIILELVLDRQSHVCSFLKNFASVLDKSQKEKLLMQKESRLDKEMAFFVRLEKQKLLEGEYAITDGGDCIHIRMFIAAFPKKREAAFGVLEHLFG